MGKHITGPACRADMIAASKIFSASLEPVTEAKDIEVSVRDATNARSMLRDMGIPYTQKASNAFQFTNAMDYENALSSFDDSGIEVMESRGAVSEASDMEKELAPLNAKLADFRSALSSASGEASKRQVRHQIQSVKMQIQKVTRKYLGGDF